MDTLIKLSYIDAGKVNVTHYLVIKFTSNRFFFPRLRFLGNAPFERSWPVTLRDPGNLQVDFFKSQAGEERK